MGFRNHATYNPLPLTHAFALFQREGLVEMWILPDFPFLSNVPPQRVPTALILLRPHRSHEVLPLYVGWLCRSEHQGTRAPGTRHQGTVLLQVGSSCEGRNSAPNPLILILAPAALGLFEPTSWLMAQRTMRTIRKSKLNSLAFALKLLH